jgi:hypothetical protein
METANDLMLDGYAAAGLLSEVFRPEATGAVARCGNCGAEAPVGTLPVTWVWSSAAPGASTS